MPGTPRAAVPAPGSGKLARTGAAPPGRTTTARAGPAAGTPIQSLIVIANSADAFELVRPIVEKNAKTRINSVENVTVGGGTRRASQRGGSTLKVTFARPISPAVVQKLKTNPALSSIQVRGPGTRTPTPAAASAMSNAANPDREGEFDWRKFATKNQPRRVPYNLLSLNDIEADSAISKSHTLSDGSVVHFTEAVIPEGDQGAALVRIPHVPGVDPATTVRALQQQAGIQELTSGEAGYTRISDNLDRAIATVNTDIRMWKSDLKTYTASLSGLTGQDKKDRQTLIQLLQKAVDVRTRELDAFNKQKNAVALRLALLKQ